MKTRYPVPEGGIRGFSYETRFSWPLSTMAEVVNLHYGKALTARDRRDGPVPVYGTNGVTGCHNEPLAVGPTVVLGRKGMGNLGVEWCLGPFWVIDTAYYTTFELDLIEPLYFYYYTRHVGLNHLKDGTSNPSLTRDRFLRQPIPLPPLADQKRIAALLGALDDRIEVNRRMNLTLEAMAQALFHRQFVDFDGRDDLMETEAGPLPSGWRNSSIGDLVELAYGKSLPKKRREDGPVPVYGSGGLTGRHSEALVEGPGIVVGRKGSIGTIYWEDDDFFPIDTTFYVVPRTEDVTLRWLYFRFVEMDLVRLGSDSAVPGLNRNAVYAQEWCVPPAVEVAAFEEVVTPLMNRMASNEAQSATLAALRDALLPKLVSGEIRVPEAEAAVEAVA